MRAFGISEWRRPVAGIFSFFVVSPCGNQPAPSPPTKLELRASESPSAASLSKTGMTSLSLIGGGRSYRLWSLRSCGENFLRRLPSKARLRQLLWTPSCAVSKYARFAQESEDEWCD
jgi:hypothetical protein